MADQISHANLFTYVSVVTGMIYADTGIEDHYSVKNHIVALRHTKNTFSSYPRHPPKTATKAMLTTLYSVCAILTCT